jgi:RNA polymerase sigma-70 factor (ECF subfamily)
VSAKEESLASIMQGRQIMDCIRQLPMGYRTVLNLYAIEGYSHKEIGELLEIGESTSRSQYTRARSMLEKLLIKREVIESPKAEVAWFSPVV